MKDFDLFNKHKKTGYRGQAIVEFAIVLPILLMMLVGILEIGRMIFIYSAGTNASRNAVRFGSAVGIDDDGLNHYNNCAGIRDIARRSAFLLSLSDSDIDIRYDHGPNDPIYTDGHGPDTTAEWNSLPTCSSSITVSSGDRVHVRITAPYSPMVRLIPIPNRTFIFSSARTIFGIVNIDE